MAKDTSFKSIPGAFYDLIVYYASVVLFIAVFIVSSVELVTLAKSASSIKTLDKIFLLLFVLSVGYVYGQLSSALSSYFIKKPVSKLARAFGFKSYKDYKFDFFYDDKSFELLGECGKGLKGNYWTLIYYIKLNAPEISDDLMKRYARVKLARTNAFNFLVLFILSLATLWIDRVALKFGLFDAYLSPKWWAVIFLFVSLVFSVEFYQRQAWLGDILIKVYSAFYEWEKKSNKPSQSDS